MITGEAIWAAVIGSLVTGIVSVATWKLRRSDLDDDGMKTRLDTLEKSQHDCTGLKEKLQQLDTHIDKKLEIIRDRVHQHDQHYSLLFGKTNERLKELETTMQHVDKHMSELHQTLVQYQINNNEIIKMCHESNVALARLEEAIRREDRN